MTHDPAVFPDRKNQPPSRVRHAGIVVQDLERQLIFYRDLLGLEEQRRMEEYGPFVDGLMGIADVRVTTCKLGCPGEQGGTQLELLAFQSPDLLEAPSQAVNRPGLTHIAFTVADLGDLADRMQKAGVIFNAPPAISPDGKAMVAYCRDFEGNFVELVELRPSES